MAAGAGSDGPGESAGKHSLSSCRRCYRSESGSRRWNCDGSNQEGRVLRWGFPACADVPGIWPDRRLRSAVLIASRRISRSFTAVQVLEKLAVPASWYPKVAARRAAVRVLAMTTPGHSLATLDGKDRHDPNHGRMKDVTDTDHQTAPG